MATPTYSTACVREWSMARSRASFSVVTGSVVPTKYFPAAEVGGVSIQLPQPGAVAVIPESTDLNAKYTGVVNSAALCQVTPNFASSLPTPDCVATPAPSSAAFVVERQTVPVPSRNSPRYRPVHWSGYC